MMAHSYFFFVHSTFFGYHKSKKYLLWLLLQSKLMVTWFMIGLILAGCSSVSSRSDQIKQALEFTCSASSGHYKVGRPYVLYGQRYVPSSSLDYNQTGIASWYGPGFHGKQTANGAIFDENQLTAAHPTLPLPSVAEVTNLRNGKTVIVRINDRGPFVGGRIIDLSRKAAEELDFIRRGITRVQVRVLIDESRDLHRRTKACTRRYR